MEPVSVLIRQGDLLLTKGLLSEAEECYIQAISNDPENVAAYARLADSYLLQGRIDEATIGFIKCLTFQKIESSVVHQIADYLRLNNNNKNFNQTMFNELADRFADNILNEIIVNNYKHTKAVTAVWDFRSQPYSIGDVILLYQVAHVISLVHGIPEIKIILLADKSCPARKSFLELGLNSDNYLDHVLKLVPVFLIGEKITSLHLENNEQAVLIAMSADDSVIWPPVLLFNSMIDLNHLSFNLLNVLYEKYNVMPEIKLRASLSDWAEAFINQKSNGLIPIAVQIRKTLNYNTSRNSNMDAWLELFRYCENQLPVTFFVICSASEVDERLRSIGNVVVAKDHMTTVDQDLALVKGCSAFMGISSGPATIAFFGNKPYSIVNIHLTKEMSSLLKKEEWGYSFSYSQKNQRIIECGSEDFDLLLRELIILIEGISISLNGLNIKYFKPVTSELRLE